MKILLVTEKCSPLNVQRDGGARLVDTLREAFKDELSIMQFGPQIDSLATWNFDYPFDLPNRFERRLANANFIAQQVRIVEEQFTHVIFIHISMSFGLTDFPLRPETNSWIFPMFLTPSYIASGEIVPKKYTQKERQSLALAKNILTPSHMEKRQLVEYYSVQEEKIHVIPRGVNTSLLDTHSRYLQDHIEFCSIGSIKPQKNTIGLIQLFSKIQHLYQNSSFKIIGPVQNHAYFEDVLLEIKRLRLEDCVKFTGHVNPEKLSSAIKDSHFHISTSTCETFGRSIFETLASGLPNIARSDGNAAAEFLQHLPYAQFVKNDHEALQALEYMVPNFLKLSRMALEVGNLYNDHILAKMLTAKICNKNCIAICDYDGTLFHKDDPKKTERCMAAFRAYSEKVICSARPIHDLIDQLSLHDLEVDWIIGCSGSIVANGSGQVIWSTPLEAEDVTYLQSQFAESKCIEHNGQVLQIATPLESKPNILGLRTEIYQKTAFTGHWKASKLHAVHRLLHHLNWSGQVRFFGDGPYDSELLIYFDGTLITKCPTNNHRQKIEVQ